MSRARAAAMLAVAALAAAGGAAYFLWQQGKEAPVEQAATPRVLAERIYSARLTDLKGAGQAVEQWRGQVVVVNFWATWCAPCREEIPSFVRLQERYGQRGLRFVGVAFDQPEKVAAFAQEFRINYPLLIGSLDTMELLREVGNRAGVLPYTVVLDRAGAIVSRQPGGVKEAALEGLVTPLL